MPVRTLTAHLTHADLSPHADTITYICTILGLLKAGCTAFLVSTRNAAAAVADMLKRTGSAHLFVSADGSMRALAAEAIAAMAREDMHVTEHVMPTFEDLFVKALNGQTRFDMPRDLPSNYDMKAPAVAMHSSGISCRCTTNFA